MKPLRTIILYSAGHLGSATILNRLINSDEFDITGIIKARPLPFTLKGARRLKQQLKKTGWQFGWLLFWQQLIQGLAFLVGFILPAGRKRLIPGWVLANDKGIPVFYCDNINDDVCIDFIKEQKPDLLISAYFNQILKKEIIQSPKIGALNVHPGWLPAYRGAMCYFWVLKNGAQKGGVTVHWIDEGIDTGVVLARQTFIIKQGWTQQKVLVQTAIVGAELLKEIGSILSRKEIPKPLPETNEEEINYFPMPHRADFKNYFSERRFFRIRDILRFFLNTRK